MALLSALNRLEAQLQTLIEGSLARLFPAPDLRRELAQHLFAALGMEARSEPGGSVLAPDRFTIFLPAPQAAALAGDSDLLAELAQDLIQAAANSNVHFNRPPVIRALPDPEASGLVSVLAEFSLTEASGETLGTAILSPPAPVVPRGYFSAYLLLENGRIFILEAGVTNLGRLPENQLSLPDERLAPLHAQIRLAQGRCILFNLDAPGGTYVNGRPVSRCDLQPGDVITLGGVKFIFGMDTSEGVEPTQPLNGL